ncbi:hypothetical protein AB4Z14_13665 [Terrabacter sp. 2TAF16]|uniref:hypothetical protein n=1 Tax=Terrabacter sp. 2TAF16 TaxID=3233008 RepID=UPI003F9B9EF7
MTREEGRPVDTGAADRSILEQARSTASVRRSRARVEQIRTRRRVQRQVHRALDHDRYPEVEAAYPRVAMREPLGPS